MERTDWIGLVEASYDLAADEATWARRVLESASPLFGDRSALALLLVEVSPTLFRVEHIEVLGPAEIRGQAIALNETIPPAVVDILYRGGATLGSLSGEVFPHFPEIREQFLAATGGGIQDVRGVAGHTGTGWVAMFSSAQAEPARRPTALERRRWPRAASHVAAGLRLRRAAKGLELERSRIEATLDPGGRVHDAQGLASASSARDLLREAVRGVEQARSSAGRGDPDAALERWRGLVAGRWSLVDRFDSDGKRFVVAVRNDPAHTDPRGLTPRERQVAEFVGLGHSIKEIAYTLGLSASTVGVCANGAGHKLGLRSHAELAAFFSPAGARTRLAEVAIAGDELLVGAYPLADPEVLSPLSDAEREIATLLIAGSTNADVASRRGTSERTVANQVAVIFRKLGVGSRSELALRVQAKTPRK